MTSHTCPTHGPYKGSLWNSCPKCWVVKDPERTVEQQANYEAFVAATRAKKADTQREKTLELEDA
jgi:hypothetical protein